MKKSLDQYIHEVHRMSETFKKEFQSLSEAQLNWKPAPNSWSIAQCMEHLMISNRQYFPKLQLLRDGAYKKNFFEKIGFLNRFWGGMIAKAVHPSNRKKTSTQQVFTPGSSKIEADILDRFEKNLAELASHFEALKGMDHDKMTLRSPVSDMITYPLEDAFTILTTHLERHFIQAKAVKSHSRFPKS